MTYPKGTVFLQQRGLLFHSLVSSLVPRPTLGFSTLKNWEEPGDEASFKCIISPCTLSLTNVPPRCLHGGNLAPGVVLNLILLCCAEDCLSTVATDGIDGIECDTSHCFPHVLDCPNAKVHTRGQHMIDWGPPVVFILRRMLCVQKNKYTSFKVVDSVEVIKVNDQILFADILTRCHSQY